MLTEAFLAGSDRQSVNQALGCIIVFGLLKQSQQLAHNTSYKEKQESSTPSLESTACPLLPTLQPTSTGQHTSRLVAPAAAALQINRSQHCHAEKHHIRCTPLAPSPTCNVHVNSGTTPNQPLFNSTTSTGSIMRHLQSIQAHPTPYPADCTPRTAFIQRRNAESSARRTPSARVQLLIQWWPLASTASLSGPPATILATSSGSTYFPPSA